MELDLLPLLVGVIVAPRTLELNAEEGLADGDDGVLRGVLILNVVQGTVLDAVALRLQEFPRPGVVGDVLLEARAEPVLESIADARVVPRRAVFIDLANPDLSGS